MAKRFDLSIVLSALDKTKGVFSGLTNSLKLSKGQMLALGAAAAAAAATIVLTAKKAVDAASIQQKAELDLADAMLQVGSFTRKAFDENLAFASSLQKITTFGDEAILTVQTMISRFVKDNESTKELTKATLDLAQAKGIDLKAAADLVSKSVGSSTNALSRYGIEIEGAAGSTERARSAVENISKIFGGAAQANALTFSGKVQQLKNVIGDIWENIGFLLIPSLEVLVEMFTEVTGGVDGWLSSSVNAREKGEELAVSFKNLIDNISTAIEMFIKLKNAVTAVLSPIVKTTKLLARFGTKVVKDTLGFTEDFKDSTEGLMDNVTDSVKESEKALEDFNKEASSSKPLTALERLIASRKNFTGLAIKQNEEISKAEKKRLKEARQLEDARISFLRASGELELEDYRTILEGRVQAEKESQDQSIEAQIQHFATLQELATLNEEIENTRMLTATEAFQNMISIMQEKQINWRNTALNIHKGFINAFQSGFMIMFNSIGKGWDAFAKGFTEIGNLLLQTITQIAAEMAAKWVVNIGIMKAATLLWKGIEIAAAAAIAAARAAAAMAWTLFGAVGIGAAVGAAVLAMAKAFQTGTRGFGGGLALVGESGPELLNLPNGTDVLNNPETRNILAGGNAEVGGGNTIQIFNDFSNSTFMGTLDEITDEISDKIFEKMEFSASV